MKLGPRWQAGGDLRVATFRLLTVGAWMGTAALAGIATNYYVSGGGVGMDAHAYWLAGSSRHPYGPGPGERDAFLYSPLFAQVMHPFAMLPWPLFCGLLMVTCGVVYYWLLLPLPWRWRGPGLLMCVPELLIGNIYALLAASLVVSLTRPAVLALPALTKITPAAVSGIWYVARGEWRHVLEAVAVTLALATASFVVQPHLWVEWFHFLVANRDGRGIGYPLRVAGAALLAVYAARADKPWVLAVAFWAAMPLSGLGPQSMIPLVALVRLCTTARPSGDAGQVEQVGPGLSAYSSSSPCSIA